MVDMAGAAQKLLTRVVLWEGGGCRVRFNTRLQQLVRKKKKEGGYELDGLTVLCCVVCEGGAC